MFYDEIMEKPEKAEMKKLKTTDFCRLPENDIIPVVTLMMTQSDEKTNEKEYYHAVTLKRSFVQDNVLTITLSDSRPRFGERTMEIPLRELSDYDNGRSVVFEGEEDSLHPQKWSLGDEWCYYLEFN